MCSTPSAWDSRDFPSRPRALCGAAMRAKTSALSSLKKATRRACRRLSATDSAMPSIGSNAWGCTSKPPVSGMWCGKASPRVRRSNAECVSAYCFRPTTNDISRRTKIKHSDACTVCPLKRKTVRSDLKNRRTPKRTSPGNQPTQAAKRKKRRKQAHLTPRRMRSTRNKS